MQRTPLVSRVNNNSNMGMQPVSAWAPRLNPTHHPNAHSHSHSHNSTNRQQFPAPRPVNPPRTNSVSDGSDNGMGAHHRPSKLSALASHNSWPNSGTNIPTRGERDHIVEGSDVTFSPKPNRRGDSDPQPSITLVDDHEKWLSVEIVVIIVIERMKWPLPCLQLP